MAARQHANPAQTLIRQASAAYCFRPLRLEPLELLPLLDEDDRDEDLRLDDDRDDPEDCFCEGWLCGRELLDVDRLDDEGRR